MKKGPILVTIVALSLLVCGELSARNTPVTKANYSLPGRFSPAKVRNLVFATSVSPHWLKHSDRFWYSYKTSNGTTFYLVDPDKEKKDPLFDNTKMAAALTRMTKDPYDAKHLPITRVKFVNDDTAFQFSVTSSKEEEEVEEKGDKDKDDKGKGTKRKDGKDKKDQGKEDKDKKLKGKGDKDKKVKGKDDKDDDKEKKDRKPKKKKKKKKVFRFEYSLETGELTLLTDYKKPPERPRWASISPDGETIVFAREYNLYWMDKKNYEKAQADEEDDTIVDHQLTKDGEEHFSYASGRRGRGQEEEKDEKDKKKKPKRKSARVSWSHDSKKFAITRSDSREVKELWVINSLAEPRPTLQTYRYAMPGDKEVPQSEMWIFEPGRKKKLKIKSDRFPDQRISILTAPASASSRDDDYRPSRWLAETADKLYFSRTSRDMHRVDICVADAKTGKVTTLIEERLNTYIETKRLAIVDKGAELIHWSERDGWGHFYLYDGEGKLKNQITQGPFHCQSIVRIDADRRVLYLQANAREAGEDPYYMHLYRVNFDGSGLTRLTLGDFNHSVSMNDSHRFFIDNFSRVDTTPKSNLRDDRGRVVLELETADLSQLLLAGFQFPEPFQVKAGDGITDLFGVMYKPFDFDPTRKYPIIAYVYPGPQTESVAKSMSRVGGSERLAQFGFIVITVGNRGGHPSRSKWYHNYGYGNLRDYGLADKKTAIEQLADRHAFIDVDRVGIFGHSGGGFMSTAAMLVYPDFFKVAVSSSGNHENNIYNNTWSEKHHGVKEVVDDKGEVKFEYEIDKNSQLAKNLKGHLLITTGEMDNNVHPANTIRLANALIKANKRFDFFLFPGKRHGYGDMTEYFFWLRGEYFCKHLIGDSATGADFVEINRDVEMSGKRRGR